MKLKTTFFQLVTTVLTFLMAVPPAAFAQETADQPVFKHEELDQMLAPIALYPDSLLAQVLMASTYPLEITQAARWVKANKALKDDEIDAALEKKDWDPSVKSLIPLPDVLSMMDDKLEWTQKVGDAFLAQQDDVMDSVQRLRAKAYEAGQFKTTKEQKVIVEKTVETQIIRVEPATEVVYVPVYNPTVVYGAWAYPAYPPYYYYPPGYVATASAFSFAAGVAVGSIWYGGFNWGYSRHHSKIKINHNYNYNRPHRPSYGRPGGGNRPGGGDGSDWKHRPEHRKGVSYRDQNTARQYNRAATNDAVRSRENFRGRAEAGRQDLSRGGQPRQQPAGRAEQFKGRQDAGQRGGQKIDRGGGSPGQTNRGSALRGMDRGGKATRDMSSRGSMSRHSMSSGGSGGGSRGGGGSRRRCGGAVVAVAAAGGRYENIPIFNTGRFKGEDNDAFRKKQYGPSGDRFFSVSRGCSSAYDLRRHAGRCSGQAERLSLC